MAITRFDILQYLSVQKELFHNQFGLTKLGLFGSFARDEQKPDSDIDIILDFAPGTTKLFEKKRALKEIIGEDLNRPVDICREKYILPHFRDLILRDAIFV